MTPAEVLALPLLACFEREDTQIVCTPRLVRLHTPSVAVASRNEVFLADLGAEVDEALHACLREPGPLKWTVVPGTQPSDMPQRLQALGFRGWWAAAMRAPGEFDAPDAQVVDTPVEVDRWVDAFAAGWAWPDVHKARLRRDVHWAFETRRQTLVYVEEDGQVVGTAAIAWGDGLAYLTGGQVLAGHRQAGLYRRLIATRIRLAGEQPVYTLARGSSSAPILARWGFDTLFEYELFQHDG